MDIEGTGPGRDATDLRAGLRRALPEALRARDTVAVAALRSALAAIDNAEAVQPDTAAPPPSGHAHLAGTVAGVGATEVERRRLSPAEVAGIIRAEMTEREAAGHDYERRGRHDHAGRVRAEAAVLRSFMTRAGPPTGGP